MPVMKARPVISGMIAGLPPHAVSFRELPAIASQRGLVDCSSLHPIDRGKAVARPQRPAIIPPQYRQRLARPGWVAMQRGGTPCLAFLRSCGASSGRSVIDRHETEHKTFAKPDETREFPHGRAEIVKVGGGEVGRFVFEPGWRWSNDVKPIAKTESCHAPHFQYHVSGRLTIRMDDGTEFVAGPGDITSLPSGHDAWVVGDEPAVVVDWFGASSYAKR